MISKSSRRISRHYPGNDFFLYPYSKHRRSGYDRAVPFLSKVPEIRDMLSIYRGSKLEGKVEAALKWTAKKTKDYDTLKAVADTLMLYHGTKEARKVARIITGAAAYNSGVTKTAARLLARRSDLLRLETDTFIVFCRIHENMNDTDLRDALPRNRIHDLVRCHEVVFERYSEASGEFEEQLKKTFFDVMNNKIALGRDFEEKSDILSQWSNSVLNMIEKSM